MHNCSLFYKLGHENIAKLLIENNATVDAVNLDGGSALTVAALRGSEHVAKVLIENGARVNLGNKFEALPIHWAATFGTDSYKLFPHI